MVIVEPGKRAKPIIGLFQGAHASKASRPVQLRTQWHDVVASAAKVASLAMVKIACSCHAGQAPNVLQPPLRVQLTSVSQHCTPLWGAPMQFVQCTGAA